MRVILGLGRGRCGLRAARRHAVCELRRPLSHVGEIVRAALQPQPPRPQPLVVAGPLTGPDVRRVDEVIAQAGLEKVPG
jgi:hypothetical protein